MMIDVGKIITLDDDTNYLVTEKVEHEENLYFRSIELTKENNLSENILIFKAVNEDGQLIVEDVPEGELYETLVDLFDDYIIKATEDAINVEEAEILKEEQALSLEEAQVKSELEILENESN